MQDFEALIQPHRQLPLHLARKLCLKGEAEPEDLVLELERAPVAVREPREWRPWELLSEDDLRRAISGLRPSLRIAVELHTAGLRYKAIARRLGISPRTVSFWMHQARHELEVSLRPLAAARASQITRAASS